MGTAPLGLRERKKQRTRRQIIEAAIGLFAERGFERTTVGEIAEAADIAPRTFFGYFPTKEAVVFHDFDEVHARFAARVAGRPAGESTIDALRSFIVEVVTETDFGDPTDRRRQQLIRCTPALQEHDRALMARFEDTLAEGVARDLDAPADSVRARMVAAAAAAAITKLEQLYDDPEVACAEGLFAPGADPLPVLDDALVFLRGGVAALRAAPGPEAERPGDRDGP
jgi:AcrR family transcriptional regulator